jgi:signal transduction histidine kinase
VLPQGLFGILLMTAMAFLEYLGAWPLPLLGIRSYPRYSSLTSLLIFLDSFAAVILCTMYLATAVVQQLRKREEKLLELQEDLSRAYDDLVALDRAKSRFVNLVAHEIRSPLAATQSLLRVATEGYAGEIGGKVKEILGRAEHRLLQLLDLVNELLDLVRGGQALPEEDKVDLNMRDTISRILKEMEGRPRGSHVDADKVHGGLEGLQPVRLAADLERRVVDEADERQRGLPLGPDVGDRRPRLDVVPEAPRPPSEHGGEGRYPAVGTVDHALEGRGVVTGEDGSPITDVLLEFSQMVVIGIRLLDGLEDPLVDETHDVRRRGVDAATAR